MRLEREAWDVLEEIEAELTQGVQYDVLWIAHDTGPLDTRNWAVILVLPDDGEDIWIFDRDWHLYDWAWSAA